ncbi:MAG: permease-like cell division protein FtsX [Alistipes sp.]|nr:permease-like cell division protein FtsX [Alistipes sp.]
MATAKRNISRRVRFSYVTSTVSMTLVLFLLGAIGFIMANLFTTTKRMRESVTMIVELKESLSEAERDSVAVRLAESDMVASLKFVSKEEKLADEEFKRVFAVDIEGILGENPLPDSYDVTLSALSSNKEGLERFADEARKIEGVAHVTYPQNFIEEMHSSLDVMQFIMVVFGGALLIVSFVLLNNTVRLAVYSQRELINTLKAVGATKWFIIRPFVGRSALQGFLAGIIASLLLGGALYALDYVVPGLGAFPRWEEAGFFAATIVALGVIVAVICTLPVVNRFVNMKSNKIYLY